MTLYQRITGALSDEQRRILDALLDLPEGNRLNGFSRLKQTPGPPTLKHIREWTERLAEFGRILDPRPFLKEIPHTKVRQFAAEAAALESGDLRDICLPGRRHALLLSFLHQVQSDTRDQLVEMFVRRMRRTQHAALERLHALRENHREMKETLIGVFGQVLHHASDDRNDTDLGCSIRQVLADQGGIDALGTQFQAVTAYHNNNYLPLLWPVHAINRAVLFRLLDLLRIESSTQDRRLLEAFEFVHQYRHSRRDTLPAAIDLGFASQRWQTFVREREHGETVLTRRALEVCVFTHISEALQSGDLFAVGSGAYADYRTQLLPWPECRQRLADYGAALGLPINGQDFVADLRERLTRFAEQVDAGFPDNSELTIDADGVPHLKRQAAQPVPDGLYAFEKAIRGRMPERHLLDVLKRAHHWSPFTRHFGPLSGSDTKLTDTTKRYLFAMFGYGCNLGANQTARHAAQSVNRHTMRRKLGSHNRQNKLYRAFRELGRVERTLFLLRYVSETDFRQSIRAETTKIESYNDFLDWIGFGGPVIKSGDPVEQVKQVKYMDLVANAVMLHNVADLTELLSDMSAEGLPVTKELVSRLSPYMREHIRRFGQYLLDMDDQPPPLEPKPLPIPP